MSSYNYRLAKIEDAPLLSVLFKQVYMDTYGTNGITAEFVNFTQKQFNPKKIERDIENNNSVLWVATKDNNPIAAIYVPLEKQCPLGEFSSPEINKLYVLRHFFGLNIGQNLMNIAENYLKANGYSNAWLWVLASNKRAVNFYKKMEYEKIGTTIFKMETNDYLNDVMRKTL
jgi:ribosomal protein S18 acetylase RimI-like enzyme